MKAAEMWQAVKDRIWGGMVILAALLSAVLMVLAADVLASAII